MTPAMFRGFVVGSAALVLFSAMSGKMNRNLSHGLITSG